MASQTQLRGARQSFSKGPEMEQIGFAGTESTPVAYPGRVQVEHVGEFKHSWRVTCIFMVLCLLAFMSALDGTIVTTSLPEITKSIGGAHKYVWIINSFLFTSTVAQPLYAQLADIFGRRHPMLVALAFFALGSGLAGAARSADMLIIGRSLQGFGSAGLYILGDIIVCDMIPPKYQAPYMGAILSTAGVATSIGPVCGGALAQVNWRWVFWINLPVASVGFIAIILLLNVKYSRSPTWLHELARVDFIGNAIFVPSMTAIFFGLIMGGTDGYAWNSWRTIVPLMLGVLGWAMFHVHQASTICHELSMPPRLFKHRTSTGGFIIIFLASIILQAINYFLPVYFQAVKGVSPLMSGVYYLTFALAVIPLAHVAAAFMSKKGLYIPLHLLGFTLSAVGMGLFSTLNDSSSRGAWIGYQVLASGGTGVVFTATLPSTLAALPESGVSVATGTYSFIRSFGLVWGATMASIIFNGQINTSIQSAGSPAAARSGLADGGAYAYSTTKGLHGGISSLQGSLRQEVVTVHVKALHIVWLVMMAVSILGFLDTFIERHIELRKDDSTEFGLKEPTKYLQKNDAGEATRDLA